MVHYNDEKRKFTSSVDIFHLPTLKWERRSTTATPPAGVMYYACTNLRDNILYFGGNCIPNNCFHNDLFELNTLTNEWREIINSSPDDGPMRKLDCGMIPFNINTEDNLVVIGGFGPTPITTHTGSKYIPHLSIPNRCYTDEIHSKCVNSSLGIILYMIHIMYYIMMISCIFFRSMESTYHNRQSSTTMCWFQYKHTS